MSVIINSVNDSRVVAYRWPNERGHFNFLHGNIRPYPDAEPLVPLSLLAEAESRIVNLENSVAAMRRTRDEMQSNLIALQLRLDAVVGLADRLGMALLTDDFDEKKRIYTELRSAALGCATTGEME